jgi:hypothetical protein
MHRLHFRRIHSPPKIKEITTSRLFCSTSVCYCKRHHKTMILRYDIHFKKSTLNNLRIKNIVERYDTTQKFGWLKIDVTKSAMKWLLKPRLNHGIAVICKGCKRKYYRTIYSTKENSKPFVVVTTRKSHRRDRRSYENECTETSTECCLKPFSINFREIGWDAVAYPPSIQANYCTGGCNGKY